LRFFDNFGLFEIKYKSDKTSDGVTTLIFLVATGIGGIGFAVNSFTRVVVSGAAGVVLVGAIVTSNVGGGADVGSVIVVVVEVITGITVVVIIGIAVVVGFTVVVKKGLGKVNSSMVVVFQLSISSDIDLPEICPFYLF
jgi:hypothetical protein